jgi:hypothetical protein
MWVGRIARQLGWGRNALRRASDRLEIRLTLVLVLATLVLSPWVGRQAAQVGYREVARSNAWEREHHHQVQAVLVESGAARPAGGAHGPDAAVAGLAVVRWTAPDGTVRTGTVYVPVRRRADDAVPIWIDDRGRVTGPPTRRNPRTGAGVAAVLSVCAVAAGLAGVRRILSWQLDRHRLRAWQTEWAVVGPVWSRQR